MMDKIVSYWNWRAASYSKSVKRELSNNSKVLWYDILFEAVEGRSGLRSLDIGTGPGFFAILLAEMGHKVTALDSSQAMLDMAAQNVQVAGQEVTFVLSDMSELPFEDESFDLLVCRNVTWMLKQPQETYNEWYRVLAGAGMLLIFDANWYSWMVHPLKKIQYRLCSLARLLLNYERLVKDKVKIRECQEWTHCLPMNDKPRPSWDEPLLKKAGFRQVTHDWSVNSRTRNWKEHIVYAYAPMFMIKAHK